MSVTTVEDDLKNEKVNKYGPKQVIQFLAMIWEVSICYFLSNSENGYKVGSDCYRVFSGKISDPFLKAPSSLYNTFFLHLHHTHVG